MTGFPLLALLVGWGMAIGLGALWVVLLFLIVMGRIDLRLLVSESSGAASMSRFQFLIFTFVIAMSLFLVTLSATPQPAFPAVPPDILALLGISGGSYVLAKGIQTSGQVATDQRAANSAAMAQVTRPK